MKLLIVDSTMENLVVCACDGDKIASKISFEGSKKHNSLILPYIDLVLTELGLNVCDMDAFGCVVGAGSFTGIRIGASTMKAFALSCKKPTIAITSFEVGAYNVNKQDFAVSIDARNNNCYVGLFKDNWQNCIANESMTNVELENKNIHIVVKDSYSDPNVLIQIAKHKLSNNQTSNLEPMYLKKSQAEREKDGD